jgi:hypothetical protein
MSNINIIILSEIQEIHLLHAYISYILLHNKVHQMVVITKGQTSDFAHSNKGTSLVNMSSMSRLMHQVVSIIESKLKTLTKWHPYVSITPLSENEKTTNRICQYVLQADCSIQPNPIIPKPRQSITDADEPCR